MIKKNKVLASIVAATLVVGTFVGCGGTTATSNNAKEITVWSHLKEKEITELTKVAEKWGSEKGVKVNVVDDKGEMQAYIQAANSSKGPDILFGVPNDNLGTFQKAGLLSEVPSGFIDESKYTSKQVIDSVTIEGKKYAVPLAAETSALFYNKALVSEVPKTMEEVVELGKKVGFEYDVTDLYRSYGFLASQGSYIFKNNNGTVDSNDIGLGNEGAIKGYQFIQDLIVKDKLMSQDITDDIAKADFQSGKSAFYISGPWDIEAFKDSGINFGIAPMPTLGGKTVSTLMGVQTAFVSSKSPNQDLSWELMKYLMENSDDLMIKQGNRIPVSKAGIESDAFKAAGNMDVFAKQLEVATAMPNIPEIQTTWTPVKNNIIALISGSMDSKETAKQIVDQIKEGIKQQK
jgi:arabinogalactan oligomer/maltooligosaccharide transport system substrate-binding protein